MLAQLFPCADTFVCNGICSKTSTNGESKGNIAISWKKGSGKMWAIDYTTFIQCISEALSERYFGV